MSADDLAGRDVAAKRPSRFQEAVQWLGQILPEGEELSYAEIAKAAEQDHISMNTVKRVKNDLGIVSVRDGVKGAWIWTRDD